MRFNQIRYFLKACELGSVSRAAEALNIAQSALSRHIHDLEIEIGADLFQREGRGVVLTVAGTRFRERAAKAMGLLALGVQEARESLRDIVDISVGLPPSVNAVVANDVQDDFSRRTGATLRTIEGWSEFLADWLLSGRLDLAVGYERSARNASLKSAIICQERYYVIRPYSGGHGVNDALSFGDIAKLPLVAPRRGHGLRDAIDSALETQGLSANVKLEIDSAAGIKQAVASGNFYAVLSGGDIVHDYRHAGLSADAIPSTEFSRALYFLWRSDFDLADRHITAMDLVRRRIMAQTFCFSG